MKDKKEKKSVKKVLRKVVQAGAAYGVLAGGAYGAYQLVSPEEARSQDEGREEKAATRVTWSNIQKYAAQTKFLRIIHAAWDNGNCRVRSLRKAIDETYQVGRGDLCALFQGALPETVSSVGILENGALELVLTYTPSKDSPEARFRNVRVTYYVGTREPTDQERLAAELEGREAAGTLDVRVWKKEGFDPGKNAWENLPIPVESQPVMKAAKEEGDKPDDCSYPRWNPRGVKYGFLSREGLEEWYL